ncbi:hypothetical protein SEA_OTTAWA_31 [Arthrobacter phage Ottawa]|nr:hypothetical protein SEA_KHARCHO_31 [Arthrobacter phage Kharcho]WIC89263.1 hypothetical protein SEA_OTTAWA_31 [Arthrobacter phage Ottawa]
MNNIAAAATESTVRIGRGLTVHAQMKGVSSVAAMCGTVSRTFGAERRTTEAVTCIKCLAQIAADEAYWAEQEEAAAAAEAEVHAAMLLEDVANEIAAEVEARRSTIVPEFDATETVVLAGIPTFAKGDVVLDKDGERFTVRRTNANGSIRLVDELGNKVNRKAANLTKV